MHSAQITQISGLVTVGYSAGALSHSVLLFLRPPPDSEPWHSSWSSWTSLEQCRSAVPHHHFISLWHLLKEDVATHWLPVLSSHSPLIGRHSIWRAGHTVKSLNREATSHFCLDMIKSWLPYNKQIFILVPFSSLHSLPCFPFPVFSSTVVIQPIIIY